MGDIRGVVFDLYGTLIRTKSNKVYPYLFSHLDRNLIKEAREIMITEDFEHLDSFIEKLDIQVDISPVQDILRDEVDSAELFYETNMVLNSLRNRGYFIGVVSNLATPYKQPFFNLGLDKLVDEWIFSCEVGVKKPQERIFQLIAKKMNLSFPEILMVGDDKKSDYVGARSCGMDALLLDRGLIPSEGYTINSLCCVLNHLRLGK